MSVALISSFDRVAISCIERSPLLRIMDLDKICINNINPRFALVNCEGIYFSIKYLTSYFKKLD